MPSVILKRNKILNNSENESKVKIIILPINRSAAQSAEVCDARLCRTDAKQPQQLIAGMASSTTFRRGLHKCSGESFDSITASHAGVSELLVVVSVVSIVQITQAQLPQPNGGIFRAVFCRFTG